MEAAVDLIPLGLYQPETLSFRVHGDQSLCVDVAKNAMLYSNKLDHLLAKDYINSPYLVEYAFFLLDSDLLLGPRQPVKRPITTSAGSMPRLATGLRSLSASAI